jgi:two-component sensor histidine kinase
MRYIKKILFVLAVSLMMSFGGAAQSYLIDSLKRTLTFTKTDSQRVDILNLISREVAIIYPEKAVIYIESAIKVAEKSNYQSGLASAITNRAFLFYTNNKCPEGIAEIKKALNIYKKSNDKRGEIKALGNLGVFHERLSEYERAKIYYTQAFLMAKEINDSTLIASNLNNIGVIYHQLGNYERAIDYYLSALVIDSLQRNKRRMGQVYVNIAESNRSLNRFDKAIMYNKRAVVVAENHIDPATEFYSTTTIGLIYGDINDFSRSSKYLEQALSIARKNEDPYQEGIALHNLGSLYADYNAEKGLQYLEEAIVIFSGNEDQLARSYINIGEIYHRKVKNNGLALANFQKAQEISEKTMSQSTLAMALKGIGMVKKENLELDEAIQYLEKSRAIADSLKDISLLSTILPLLADSYYNKKLYNKGYQFLEMALNVIDSLVTKERATRDVFIKYETEKRENEIAQKDIKLLENEIRLKEKNQHMFIILSLIAIFLSLLIYINNKIRIKNKMLKFKNELLETYKREGHHRTSNNIQLISSILFSRMKQTNNTVIKKEISAIRNRILAMGSVHNQLYIGSNQKSVKINEFLNGLIEYLMDFNQNKEDNTIELYIEMSEIEGVEILFDKALQVGLIVNEVVTNSFKYAFINNPSPKLSLWAGKKNEDVIQIRIGDNGKGFNNTEEAINNESFGMKMIETLTKGLKWKSCFTSSNSGVQFDLEFSLT